VPLAFDPILAFYAVPLVVVWTVYLGMRKKVDARSRSTQAEAKEAGLTEPASLHPLIDPVKCLGCGACVRACPEVASGHPVLGIIDDRAELIEPASCIGHGACKAACPTDAITLVFGTETRGVELPIVKPDFQTNVPGLFIAGELGGTGLIRNAIEQGRQAMESIKALCAGEQATDMLDVVIIGAGPAGFSASLGALSHKLKFVTLEQDSFGGTVGHFPRGKLVMTAPAMLPLIGRMQFREVSKETLMAFLARCPQKDRTKDPLWPARRIGCAAGGGLHRQKQRRQLSGGAACCSQPVGAARLANWRCRVKSSPRSSTV
jgi:thioredoxin reductase (NADPH)